MLRWLVSTARPVHPARGPPSGAGELLTLRTRERRGPALAGIGVGLLHPSPKRRLGKIEISSDWGMVFPPSKTRCAALALNSSVKLRLCLRGFLSSPMLDTVSTSPRVSTAAEAVSSGLRNDPSKYLGWLHPVERLSWARVDFLSNSLKTLLLVAAEVRALGEILS
jgi:hypothetical protein